MQSLQEKYVKNTSWNTVEDINNFSIWYSWTLKLSVSFHIFKRDGTYYGWTTFFSRNSNVVGTKNVYCKPLFFNAVGTLISLCFQLNEHKHADRTLQSFEVKKEVWSHFVVFPYTFHKFAKFWVQGIAILTEMKTTKLHNKEHCRSWTIHPQNIST
jgi:hypothetical protein